MLCIDQARAGKMCVPPASTCFHYAPFRRIISRWTERGEMYNTANLFFLLKRNFSFVVFGSSFPSVLSAENLIGAIKKGEGNSGVCASNSVSLDWTLKPQKQLHISSAVAVVFLFLFKRRRKKNRKRIPSVNVPGGWVYPLMLLNGSIRLVRHPSIWFSSSKWNRESFGLFKKIKLLSYYVMLRVDAVVVIFTVFLLSLTRLCGLDKDWLTLLRDLQKGGGDLL